MGIKYQEKEAYPTAEFLFLNNSPKTLASIQLVIKEMNSDEKIIYFSILFSNRFLVRLNAELVHSASYSFQKTRI